MGSHKIMCAGIISLRLSHNPMPCKGIHFTYLSATGEPTHPSKIHTNSLTFLVAICKQSTYLTVVLSELVHLKPRKRETHTETGLRQTDTGRAAKQADVAAASATASMLANKRICFSCRRGSNLLIKQTQIHAKANGSKCCHCEWLIAVMHLGFLLILCYYCFLLLQLQLQHPSRLFISHLLSLGSMLLKVTLFTG